MIDAVQLGRSGLRVSRLILGTMNLGIPGRGHQGDWTLGIDDARPIIAGALERGVFTFDCADVYGLGASEEVLGALLRELSPREDYVLATKVSLPVGRGPNRGGLSRKHIIEGVDASLRRLGHDYIDQLVIHRHPHGIPGATATPIEESLEALHDLVRAGKVLYLGASSMFAWQFAELQHTATANHWTPFVSMQNHWNLIYREEEREMVPYCRQTGVAVTPWSPLARGILAGTYRGGFGQGSTARSSGQDRARTEGLYRGEMDFAIADRVVEVAQRIGVKPAQVALAWLLSKPEVTAPVVGVSKLSQLDDLAEACTIRLGDDDVGYLEELYRPLTNLLSIGMS